MKKYFLILLLASAAHADIMNLNNYMPTRLEDATPIPAKSFDTQLSMESEQRRTDMITIRPDVRYGISEHLQFESSTDIYSGNGEDGSGGTDLSLLYRLNTGEHVPIFSITPAIELPSGKGLDQSAFALQFNTTYTLSGTNDTPKSELHLNLLTGANKNRDPGERGSLETLIFGSSHRLTEYVAMVLDVALEEQDEKKDFLQVAEFGLHIDLGRMNYFAVSYSQGFGNSCTRSAGLLGLEHQFGP